MIDLPNRGRPRPRLSRYKPWIPLVLLLGAVAGIGVLWWWGNQPAPRPKSMPSNSVWIEAPTLPVSWHKGWWFGCWIDSDGRSDRCRLWRPGSDNPVVYDGLYVSCDTHSPLPADKLKLKAPDDSMQMWVSVPSHAEFAPAAFLQNGDYLVPLGAPHACEELQKEMKHQGH